MLASSLPSSYSTLTNSRVWCTFAVYQGIVTRDRLWSAVAFFSRAACYNQFLTCGNVSGALLKSFAMNGCSSCAVVTLIGSEALLLVMVLAITKSLPKSILTAASYFKT